MSKNGKIFVAKIIFGPLDSHLTKNLEICNISQQNVLTFRSIITCLLFKDDVGKNTRVIIFLRFFVKLYIWRKTWLLCPIRTVTFTTIPRARREIRANFGMSLWLWIKKQNVDFGNLENVLQLIACLGKSLKQCRHFNYRKYRHSVEKREIYSHQKVFREIVTSESVAFTKF